MFAISMDTLQINASLKQSSWKMMMHPLISSKSSKKEELEKIIKISNKQFTQLLKSHVEDGDDDEESDAKHSNFQFTQHDSHYDISMKQSTGKLKDLKLRNVILLDNQSTMSLFSNRKLVKNIQKSEETLTLRSNGGSMEINKVASIKKHNTDVWFSSDPITNILLLKDVKQHYHVTYDSYDKSFIVWRDEKGLPNMDTSGLLYYDPSKEEFLFVVTVADNMKLFSKQQIAPAQKAKTLLAGLAFPSEPDNNRILRSNQVQECPVTEDDATVAHKIWGPDVPSLKGKTTRKTPPTVPTDIVAVPMKIRVLHRNVTMSIDVFYVNKILFFLTLRQKIMFTTVTHLAN